MAKYDEKGFITELEDNEIFVFGSNMAGRHGAGAAKQAHEQFGAIYGEGEGVRGQSYAFATLDRNLNQLNEGHLMMSIIFLIADALSRPHRIFLMTKVGCGLGGFTEDYIVSLFKKFAERIPDNIVFPADWHDQIFS